MSLLTYKYYDTPEGHDIFKKTFVTTKYAILSSLPVATFDVLLYSHPKGIFQTVMRYGFYFGPAISMATAFTLTTNIAQNVRGKNDELNYFLGGAAAGAVFASLRRQPVIALPAAIILGACGVVKKIGIENNFTFFPKTHSGKETINSIRRDWTLVKDIDELKNWETGSK